MFGMQGSPGTSTRFDFSRFFQGWRAGILLLIALAIPLWHLHIINREMPSSHSDLVDEWMGVREALQGKDPYSAEVTRDIQIAYYGRPLTATDKVSDQFFPYPATLVIPFAPLAPLSWSTVRVTYLLLIIPLILISFCLCARFVDPTISPRKMAMVVFLACCSWPVMWALRLQQPTLFVAVLVFTAIFLLSREQSLLAGILLAFATIKPQLVLLLIIWLFVWACARRTWSFMVSFALTMAGLLLWTERLVPGWFPHWIGALHHYGNRYGQIKGQLPLENVFGHWLGLGLTAALVGYSAFTLWRLRYSPPRSPGFRLAAALALVVALCLIPTLLPLIYNQILLLPGCLILVLTPSDHSEDYYPGLASRITVALILWGYVVIFVAALCESIFGSSGLWDSLPFENMLVPVFLTLALVLRHYSRSTAGQPALEVRLQTT